MKLMLLTAASLSVLTRWLDYALTRNMKPLAATHARYAKVYYGAFLRREAETLRMKMGGE
jgi:hypothetical protein